MIKNVYLKALIITILYFLLGILTGFLSTLFLGKYLMEINPSLIRITKTIAYLITLLIILFFVRKAINFTYVFNKKSIDYKFISLIFVGALLYIIISDPLYNYDLILYSKKYISENNQIPILQKALIFSNLVVLTVIAEELVFRKVILGILIKKGILNSLLFSSLLFALIHINPYSIDYVAVLNAFIAGIVSGLVYLNKGIIYSILFHCLYNFLVFLVQINDNEYWSIINQLNFGFTYWAIIILCLILFIFFIIYLFRILQRKDKVLA